MRVDTIQAGDFLRLSAQRFPDRDCFVFDDGSSRSFAAVSRRVNQLAGALHGRGIRKGDRVAILATGSGEYVEVLMACMKLGAIYVPLNNRLADAAAARSCPATWKCRRRAPGRCGTAGSGAVTWRGWTLTATCTWRAAART